MNGDGRMMRCGDEQWDYVLASDKACFISTKQITAKQTWDQEILVPASSVLDKKIATVQI